MPLTNSGEEVRLIDNTGTVGHRVSRTGARPGRGRSSGSRRPQLKGKPYLIRAGIRRRIRRRPLLANPTGRALCHGESWRELKQAFRPE